MPQVRTPIEGRQAKVVVLISRQIEDGRLGLAGAAIQLTLSIVSFQRDRFYVPLDGWGRAWLMLAFFALTGQLALCLFAVRRRFKR